MSCQNPHLHFVHIEDNAATNTFCDHLFLFSRLIIFSIPYHKLKLLYQFVVIKLDHFYQINIIMKSFDTMLYANFLDILLNKYWNITATLKLF